MTTTPRDAIGLSERLRERVRILGQSPDSILKFMDRILPLIEEAAIALDALQGEISQWANEVARYKAYAEKFDEENAALQARVKEADEACQRLCRDHGFATSHGDSVADMIDEISAQVKKLIYVPGSSHCPKCKFTLLQSNLNAQDGTVTARDTPGDKCPNCNGPLWRCTWKNDAFEMQERAVEQMERAKSAESRATRAAQERDEALERLKPFAKAAAAYDPEDGEPDSIVDKDTLWGDDDLTVGHCRAARDLVRRLAAGTEKEGK